jgi:hypothetical protein
VALARRLLAFDEAEAAALRGVAGPGLLALLGEAASLPWVDGILYLGEDPAAPGLVLPTTRFPSVPPALLDRALRARFPDLAPPLAVLPAEQRLFSLAGARPVARARLIALAGEER